MLLCIRNGAIYRCVFYLIISCPASVNSHTLQIIFEHEMLIKLWNMPFLILSAASLVNDKNANVGWF